MTFGANAKDTYNQAVWIVMLIPPSSFKEDI